jgi:hypothetical protein
MPVQDFTLSTYNNLLQTLLSEGYTFQTFRQYLEQPQDTQTIILRHDVDNRPDYSLEKARLENELGISSTYFFRILPHVFKPEIIKEIATLGHEVGYHYEDLSLATDSVGSRQNAVGRGLVEAHGHASADYISRQSAVGSSGEVKSRKYEEGRDGETEKRRDEGKESSKQSSSNEATEDGKSRQHVEAHGPTSSDDEGNTQPATNNMQHAKRKTQLITRAYELFKHHLQQFRQIYPVKTICMHGSPISKWDSKRIWDKYDYRELGILGEPYFDINFNEVFYLTDTGRRWDGWKVSLRDKVPQQEQWKKQGLVFHSTQDIIKAAKENRLPNKIMITTHPERWTDRPLPWVRELVWQNMKNVVKRILVARGRRSEVRGRRTEVRRQRSD